MTFNCRLRLKGDRNDAGCTFDQFRHSLFGLNSSAARSRHFWSAAQPNVFLGLCGTTLRTRKPFSEKAASFVIASP
jgi:hypothetical protein